LAQLKYSRLDCAGVVANQCWQVKIQGGGTTGATAWLSYILSFFIPVFGFISFRVFWGREVEADTIGRGFLIASFIGLIVYIILAAVGIIHGMDLLQSV
jgi:hypothetical protein